MCIPSRSQRNQQRQVATAQQGIRLAVDSTGKMQPLPFNEIKIPCTNAVLVKLVILGAETDASPTWAAVSQDCLITVNAETNPPNTPVTFKPSISATSNSVKIPRTIARKDFLVSAALNGKTLTASIDIINLKRIESTGKEIFIDHTSAWKTYECATSTVVMATAETTDTNISNSVTWSVDAQGVGETAQINRDWPNEKTDSTAVIRTAKAQLGKVCPQIRSQTIRVCRWPKLKLKLVDFICEEVNNDGYTLCTQVFDRKWIEGRAQPKAYNTPDATKCQSVLCFVGGGTIKLSAKFTVLQVPTDSEKVKITGTAVFGGINLKWEQEVTVNPGDKEVTFTEIHSDNPLNAGVATGAPLKISWTATAPTVLYADGSTDEPEKIGESENLSYVVLKKNPVELKTNPTKIVRYWTLLEVSCRGANGKTTENDFVPAAFAPFKLSTGDNKGMQRMGDGERLSYYKHGDETVATADVYTALGILSSADGTGRCGGWADVLIHLFNMHGVDSATKYALVRYYKKTLTNTDRTLRFLVKNCTLPATTNIHAAPYRNFGNTLSKTDGVSGQGKTNPQFDFSDHVTVKHNGQIYDPSYGIGPYNSTYEYEQAAIEGYALYPNGVGQYQCTGKYDKLRISKFISDECLYTHITDNGDTLLSIAAKYQNTLTNQLRRLNPSLQANKDDDPLPVATEVYVILHRTGAVLYWT